MSKDQRFQLLLNQAEAYMEKEQSRLYQRLKQSGQLKEELEQRARQAQLVLQQCQDKGLDQGGTAELVNEALMPGPGDE